MNTKTLTYNSNSKVETVSLFQDYMMLIKMRLTSLVVFTSLGAYGVASNVTASLFSLFILGLGGFCVVAASNAINQVLEKDFDLLMKRTQNRPLAAGRMQSSTAVLFSGFLCLFGITLLAYFNALAAFFGMIAFILYAFVYTPLKRYSRSAVFVGAIAGAMPMLIGCIAYSGEITQLALLLFVIQIAWQFPHFWSIAYLGYEDYSAADYRFIPTEENGSLSRSVGVSSVIYAVVLVCASIILLVFNLIGLTAMIGLLSISILYLFYSIKFYRLFNQESAKQLMFSSLIYIPMVLIIMLIDKMF